MVINSYFVDYKVGRAMPRPTTQCVVTFSNINSLYPGLTGFGVQASFTTIALNLKRMVNKIVPKVGIKAIVF